MKTVAIIGALCIGVVGVSVQAIEMTIYAAEDTSASYVGLTNAVTWHGNYSGADVKTFWKFSLADLVVPAGCRVQVNSAVFRLHGESASGDNLPTETVYQVLDNEWTAGGFLLSGAPPFGPVLGTYNYPGGFVGVSIDCTNYLQSVLDAGGTAISFGSQAPNHYVDEAHTNRFRMIGKAYTQYGIAYTPRIDFDYTLVSTEPSEINLATVPVVHPAPGAVTTPIFHQRYFRGERELFEYYPRFTPSDVSFDPENRPYIRVAKHPDGRDFFSSDNTTLGVIQTLDDAGNWIELDTFLPAIKAMYPIWNGKYSAGVSMDERIVFDSSGDAYTVVQTYSRPSGSNLGFNVLLHSKDRCRTWRVYPLSATHYFTKWEVPDGNNDTDRPPVLLVWPYGFSGGPIHMIVPRKTASGNLTLPVVTVTTDPAAYPLPNQSGMGNSTVSKGDKIHVVYMRNAAYPGYTGTPQYVVTYDRSTGQVTSPVLLGVSNNSVPDIHDGPAITVDSQGYLHVVIGAHHGLFKYTKSLAPNSSTAGWTEAADIGNPNYAGWTYVSLLCDRNDTLHVVGRNAGYCYYFALWYMRRPASGNWEDLGPLVMPFRPYYSNWYHRLSLDRQNRLFLNYMYYGDQFDRGSPYTYEIDAYRAKWPWENPVLVDPVNTYWDNVSGHDPAMIMSDDGGNSWRLALTPSMQIYFENNSFENGLDGWTLNTSPNANPIQVVSSYTCNGKTLTPRTGATFARSEPGNGHRKATRTLPAAEHGVFTGYINMIENVNEAMIRIDTPGHMAAIVVNAVPGKVSYRLDSEEISTDIPVATQTWHQVKFIAGPAGIEGYWNGTRLFRSPNTEKITSIIFGSEGAGAPCGFDDFSFQPVTCVQGRVTLGGFSGPPAGVSVTLKIFAPGSGSPLETQTVALDAEGNYAFYTQVPSGSYDVWAKASHWLAAKAVNVTLGAAALDFTMAGNGDANGDNLVTFEDFAVLQNHYGQAVPPGTHGDFNDDGQVAFDDFAILQNSYGQAGAVDVPASAAMVPVQVAALSGLPCALVGIVLLSVLTLAFAQGHAAARGR